LLFGELGLLHSFVDFLAGLLGVGELIDKGLVFEELVDVALGAGQCLEDRVFDFDQYLFVL
jgi:hypothetical protein